MKTSTYFDYLFLAILCGVVVFIGALPPPYDLACILTLLGVVALVMYLLER